MHSHRQSIMAMTNKTLHMPAVASHCQEMPWANQSDKKTKPVMTSIMKYSTPMFARQ
jgi:hypothetical protein